MGQTIFKTTSGIQNTMIEVLKRDNVHAMVLFGFTQSSEGIVPLLIVSNDMPKQQEVSDTLYALFDAVLDFRKIQKESKKKKKG